MDSIDVRRAKQTARRQAQRRIRITRAMRCELCGCREDLQRHHDDHSKPLDVRIFCREHHADEHVRMRRAVAA